ncbi:hypothetical protein ACFOU2_15565 [Bacillus songklensis]|uniref:Membrane-spanning protein n=1 Tax=Bacillus songklensis TaxID=1069116 RepID=A0ABV8B3C8_9BACI
MKRKVIIIISLIYVLFMAALFVFYFSKDDSYRYLIAIGGIICGAVPLILVRFTKIKFNMPIMLSYLAFIFGSQFLGSILGFYGLGWWDTFLHFLSGALLGFVAIALFERMTHKQARHDISCWLVFLFVLSFAVLGGVLWEIYEFSGDQFFDMTMQGGGNTDTMIDLTADAAGGLVIAISAAIRTKRKFEKT